MQVPIAHMAMGKRIAILTANSNSLTEKVLRAAGITADMPIVIAGLQDVAAFRDPILHDGATLQKGLIEMEILSIADKLLQEYPDIGAFVFECHNLAPYGRALQQRTGKPVFDIIDFASWIYSGIVKRPF